MYGFNGKENDNDVKGEGNQQDYGMRIYDPRLGKFLSTDPLKAKYPSWTPYAFAMNDVIRCVDLDGEEKKVVIHWIDGFHNDGAPKLKQTSVDINKNITYINVYTATGLPVGDGKKFAGTETYYALPDGRFIHQETMYEEIGKDKPVPSAAYDYTQNVIPGKFEDDMSYITEGPKGFLPAWWEIGERDSKAPDNAQTLEDLGGVNAALAVIGVRGMRGSVITENANMSAFSRTYQRQIGGLKDNEAFMLNGVRFDGIAGDVLKEAKGKYAYLIEKGWVQESFINQAQRQIKAANGLKVEWHFAEKEAADAVKTLFEKQGIKGIDVFHTPSL